MGELIVRPTLYSPNWTAPRSHSSFASQRFPFASSRAILATAGHTKRAPPIGRSPHRELCNCPVSATGPTLGFPLSGGGLGVIRHQPGLVIHCGTRQCEPPRLRWASPIHLPDPIDRLESHGNPPVLNGAGPSMRPTFGLTATYTRPSKGVKRATLQDPDRGRPATSAPGAESVRRPHADRSPRRARARRRWTHGRYTTAHPGGRCAMSLRSQWKANKEEVVAANGVVAAMLPA